MRRVPQKGQIPRRFIYSLLITQVFVFIEFLFQARHASLPAYAELHCRR